ncbi:MAG TPA: patatin-like phospholipase family protein [Actinomycetes bacterium]|nr:patatin-like phospholipase family protein [Actinomycetes bacterium]
MRSCEPLRRLLAEHLGVRLIEELPVRFQCVAAGIERAIGHWFTEGPIQDAVVASAAVPGLLPPVRVGEEHYIDGGIVDSIPVGRAVTLGARTVYVLQVGRIERPLEPPTRPWEVGLVAFEIARRCRFTEEMANLPPSLEVHVLPTGADEPTRASLPPLRPTATSSGSASASSAPTRRPPRTSARSRVAEAPWSRRGWCAGSCSTRWSWCWPSSAPWSPSRSCWSRPC